MTKVGRMIMSVLLIFLVLAICLILTSCVGQPEERNWLIQSWAQVQGVWESESYTDQNGEIHSLAYSETHELMISGDSIVSTYCGSSNAGRIWLWVINDETYIYHTTIGLTIGFTKDTFGATPDGGNVVWYCRTSEPETGFEMSNK
nr:MAG TPA: hypothetical protein [Caudoviricetes sp.]